MKTIWKYELQVDRNEIEIPQGAAILSVQTQNERPCIWFELFADNPKETRVFEIFGTGHTLPNSPGRYIGTIQLMDGKFVGHIYERFPKDTSQL